MDIDTLILNVSMEFWSWEDARFTCGYVLMQPRDSVSIILLLKLIYHSTKSPGCYGNTFSGCKIHQAYRLFVICKCIQILLGDSNNGK